MTLLDLPVYFLLGLMLYLLCEDFASDWSRKRRKRRRRQQLTPASSEPSRLDALIADTDAPLAELVAEAERLTEGRPIMPAGWSGGFAAECQHLTERLAALMGKMDERDRSAAAIADQLQFAAFMEQVAGELRVEIGLAGYHQDLTDRINALREKVTVQRATAIRMSAALKDHQEPPAYPAYPDLQSDPKDDID